MTPDTLNIMLDLETLGVNPGCKILSIGACIFDTDKSNFVASSFYIRCNPELQSRLNEDIATQDWWAKQDPLVRQEAFGGKEYIHVALQSFCDWVTASKLGAKAKKINLWCRGATFDAPIIEEAMRRYSVNIPWKFFDIRCSRTLSDLGISLGIDADPFDGDKHNALHDAINQAAHAEKILEVLRAQVR